MIRAATVILIASLLGLADAKTDPKWLDGRLPSKARAKIETLSGSRVPPPPASVRWVGGGAPTIGPGRVTVIQSITPGGKGALDRTRKALPDDVLLVGLHGPKKADRAEKDLGAKSPCAVAIDAEGEWMAALNLPESPTNILVDDAGIVRLCGIRTEALKAACESLRSPDPHAEGGQRPMDGVMTGFPTDSTPVQNAVDRRGQTMPAFDVDQWVTDRPATPDRKLLVLDFWATWCGPCVAAIPHMNELATRFADIAQCVGVSDEQQSAFQQGLSRIGRSTRDFKYALALAPSRKLHTFFGIKGIPHCVVVSSDGIVRWQGHPMALTEEMFGRYAEAQKALNAAKPAPASKPDVNPPGGPRKY